MTETAKHFADEFDVSLKEFWAHFPRNNAKNPDTRFFTGYCESKDAYPASHVTTKFLELLKQFQAKLPSKIFLRKLIDIGESLVRKQEYRLALEACFDAFTDNFEDPENPSADDLELKVRAMYGSAACTMEMARSRDNRCSRRSTLTDIMEALRTIRRAMALVLPHEALYWLVFNGTVLMESAIEPLVTVGFSTEMVEFALWASVAMESVIPLLAPKYLRWRVHLYCCVCRCYEDLHDSNSQRHWSAAQAFAQRAYSKLQELDALLKTDSAPMPQADIDALESAFYEIRLRLVRYACAPGFFKDTRTISDMLREHFKNDTERLQAIAFALADPSTRRMMRRAPVDGDRKEPVQALFSIAASIAGPHIASMTWYYINKGHNLQPPASVASEPPVPGYKDAKEDGGGKKKKEKEKKEEKEKGSGEKEEKVAKEVSEEQVAVARGAVPLELQLLLVKLSFNYEENSVGMMLPLLGVRISTECASGSAQHRPLQLQASLIQAVQDLDAVTSFQSKATVMKRLADCLTDCANSDELLSMYPDMVIDSCIILWLNCKPELQSLQEKWKAKQDADPALLQMVTHWLSAVNTVSSAVALDDPLLTATIALELASAFEHGGQLKQGVQVLRAALIRVEAHRSRWLSESNESLASVTAAPLIFARTMLPPNLVAEDVSVGTNDLRGLEETLWCSHLDLHAALFRMELQLAAKQDRTVLTDKVDRQKLARDSKRESMRLTDKDKRLQQEASAKDQASLQQPEVPSLAAESSLLRECGKNLYLRALLMMHLAVYRRTAKDQHATLEAAADLLVQAQKAEEDLMLAFFGPRPHPVVGSSPTSILNSSLSGFGVSANPTGPAAPRFILRSNMWMAVRPEPYKKAVSFAVFGKTAGTGVAVSVNNTDLSGTGTKRSAGPGGTGNTSGGKRKGRHAAEQQPITFEIRGLTPNQSYVFAVAVYDASGSIIGTIGQTSQELTALQPLPLLMLWGYLALQADTLSCPKVFKQASQIIYDAVVINETPVPIWKQNPLLGSHLDRSTISTLPLPIIRLASQVLIGMAETSPTPRPISSDHAVSLSPALTDQLQLLRTSSRALMAMQLALILADLPLLIDALIKLYQLLVPLFSLQPLSPLVLQGLTEARMAIEDLPDEEILRRQDLQNVVALLSYHLTSFVSSHEESKARNLCMKLAVKSLALLESNCSTRDTPTPGLAASNVPKPRMPLLYSALKRYLLSTCPAATEELAAAIPTREEPDREVTLYRTVMSRGPAEAFEELQGKLPADPRAVEFICRLCQLGLRQGKLQPVELWIEKGLEVFSRQCQEAIEPVQDTLEDSKPPAKGGLDSSAKAGTKLPAVTKKPGTAPKKEAATKDKKGPKTSTSPEVRPDSPSKVEEELEAKLGPALQKGRRKLKWRSVWRANIRWRAQLELLKGQVLYARERDPLPQRSLASSPTPPDTASAPKGAAKKGKKDQEPEKEKEKKGAKGAPSATAAAASAEASDGAQPLSTEALASLLSKVHAQPEFVLPLAPPSILAMSRACVLACRARCWSLLQDGAVMLLNCAKEIYPRRKALMQAKKVPAVTSSLDGPLGPPVTNSPAEDLTLSRKAEEFDEIWRPLRVLCSTILEMLQRLHRLQATSESEKVEENGVGPRFPSNLWSRAKFAIGITVDPQPFQAPRLPKSLQPQLNRTPAPAQRRRSQSRSPTSSPPPPALPVEEVGNSWFLHFPFLQMDVLAEVVKFSCQVCIDQERYGCAADLSEEFDELTGHQHAESLLPITVEALQKLISRFEQQKMDRIMKGERLTDRELQRQKAQDERLKETLAEKKQQLQFIKRDRPKTLEGLLSARRLLADFMAVLSGEKAKADSTSSLVLAPQPPAEARKKTAGRSLSQRAVHASPPNGLPANSDSALFSAHPDLAAKVVAAYESSIQLLRQKRETELLVQALNELGDFWCIHSQFKQASEVWTGVVDAVFNTLNTMSQWRALWAKLPNPLHSIGLWNCINSGISLYKLSWYIATRDQHSRLEYCLLGAKLLAVPFRCSLPHPQRHSQFRDYKAMTIWPGLDLFSAIQRVNAAQLCEALEFFCCQLTARGHPVDALPLAAFLEHIAQHRAHDAALTTFSRILRIEALLECGYIREAIALLSDVLDGRGMPQLVGYSEMRAYLEYASDAPHASLADNAYRNHLPPDNPVNEKALRHFMAKKISPLAAALYGPFLVQRAHLARVALLLRVSATEDALIEKQYADKAPVDPLSFGQGSRPPSSAAETAPPPPKKDDKKKGGKDDKKDDKKEKEKEKDKKADAGKKDKGGRTTPVAATTFDSVIVEALLQEAETSLTVMRQDVQAKLAAVQSPSQEPATIEETKHPKEKEGKSEGKKSKAAAADAAVASRPGTVSTPDPASPFVFPSPPSPLATLELETICKASLGIAQIHARRGKFSQAVQLMEQLLSFLARENPRTWMKLPKTDTRSILDIRFWLLCRLRLAEYLLQLGRFEHVRQHCSLGIAEADKVTDLQMGISFRQLSVRADIFEGHTTAAIDTLRSILAKAAASSIADEQVAVCLVTLGDILVSLLGSGPSEIEEARRLYKEAHGILWELAENAGLDMDPDLAPELRSMYLPHLSSLVKLQTRIATTCLVLGDIDTASNVVSLALQLSPQAVHLLPTCKASLRLLAARLARLQSLRSSPDVRGNPTPTHVWGTTPDLVVYFSSLGSQEQNASPLDQQHVLSHVPTHIHYTLTETVHRGFHDHVVVRNALLEMAYLFGQKLVPGRELQHLSLAAFYLDYAGRVSKMQGALTRFYDTLDSSPLADLKGLPEGVLNDIQEAEALRKKQQQVDEDYPALSQAVSLRSVVHHYLALLREKDVAGFHNDALILRIIKLHRFLRQASPLYSSECCLPDIPVAPAQITFPPGFVCSQWFEAGDDELDPAEEPPPTNQTLQKGRSENTRTVITERPLTMLCVLTPAFSASPLPHMFMFRASRPALQALHWRIQSLRIALQEFERANSQAPSSDSTSALPSSLAALKQNLDTCLDDVSSFLRSSLVQCRVRARDGPDPSPPPVDPYILSAMSQGLPNALPPPVTQSQPPPSSPPKGKGPGAKGGSQGDKDKDKDKDSRGQSRESVAAAAAAAGAQSSYDLEATLGPKSQHVSLVESMLSVETGYRGAQAELANWLRGVLVPKPSPPPPPPP